MVDRAKKKEKHRLKRLKKQRDARKEAGISPLRLIFRDAENLECVISRDWQVQGLGNLLVLGTAPDGRHAFAGFLIDFWCVGLKDAWGRDNVTLAQFNDVITRAKQATPLVEIDADDAADLVASGIRFSRQNGFRLPKDWDRWTRIFGGVGDVSIADLSKFGKDGGLLYVGDEAFLRQRLISCTIPEFFSRPGVHYVLGVEDPNSGMAAEDDFENEDSDQSFNQLRAAIHRHTGGEVRAIAARQMQRVLDVMLSKDVAPHPRFSDAADYMIALLVTDHGVKAAGLKRPETTMTELFDAMMEQEGEPNPDSLWEAIDQILIFSQPDNEELTSAGAMTGT